MPTIAGSFSMNGIPRNDATVKLWSEGAFVTPPAKNDPIPSGSPIATGTTSTDNGADGAYRFTGVTSGAYYASVEWNGAVVYDYHRVDDATGLGYTLATNYPDLQSAINATPSGGTLFIPSGTYTITTGLVVSGKAINIQGDGRGVILEAGANDVVVLTLQNDTGVTTDAFIRHSYFEDFSFRNTGSFTGITFLRLVRVRRNDFYNIRFDGGALALSGTAIDLRSCWINSYFGCYIDQCGVGIEGRNYSVSDGRNTSLQYIGGMIENCVTGYYALNTSMDHLQTTIEACTSVGIAISGCNRLDTDGCYFENTLTNAWDVVCEGAWRAIRLDNCERVKLEGNGQHCTLTNYRDVLSTGARLAVSDSCREVLVINPWWNETAAGGTASLTDIITAQEEGRLRIVRGSAEPNAHCLPMDSFGENLIANGELLDGAPAFTKVNFVADAADYPFGTYASLVTNSGVSGTTCTATVPIDAPSGTSYQNRVFTLSCMVKIPDTTCTAQLVLIDGDRNKGIAIPNAYKTGNWEYVNVSIRTGTAAESLFFRFSCTEGVSGSIRFSNAALTAGELPAHCISAQLEGANQTFVRQRVKAVVALTTSGQIDPSLCGVHVVSGSGGPITITSGQAFFSASGNWLHGMTVMLIGSSNTDTVTFISGIGSNLRLGAATRTLAQDGTLTLFYHASTNRWLETGFSPGGF